MSLIADLAADELVDPALVVDAKPGALPERKLRCQARHDSRAHAGFGVKRDHGWEATARAWSGAPTGSSFPGGAPGVAMTATSLMTSAAYTKAGACRDVTATMKPPGTTPRTSTPSANGTTAGWSDVPEMTSRSIFEPTVAGGASFTGMKTRRTSTDAETRSTSARCRSWPAMRSCAARVPRMSLAPFWKSDDAPSGSVA